VENVIIWGDMERELLSSNKERKTAEETMSQDQLEKARRVLQKLDVDTLERKARRLSKLPAITFLGDIPSRTSSLLSEADSCFVNGEYNGCVAVLATAVEYSLRKLLNEKSTLETLINLATTRGILNEQDAKVLHKLRQYRNNVIHSDLTELAKGVVLREQEVILTEKGMVPMSDWKEAKPEDETMKEVASSLAAEAVVGELLLNVDRFLCKLYGGTLEKSL